MLLLAGDVETNPGPETSEIQQILETVQRISELRVSGVRSAFLRCYLFIYLLIYVIIYLFQVTGALVGITVGGEKRKKLQGFVYMQRTAKK